jgi:F0F1-type ATP synthase assembly protein I
MNPSRTPKQDPSGLRSAGLLLSIPSLLIVSPLVGFFLGKFVDRWLGSEPTGSIVGLVLGFVTAGREIYLIIRRVQAEEEGDKRP